MDNSCKKNTDVEIWREVKGDHYSDSIHITRENGIGINVGGHVIVKTAVEWHRLYTNRKRNNCLIRLWKAIKWMG